MYVMDLFFSGFKVFHKRSQITSRLNKKKKTQEQGENIPDNIITQGTGGRFWNAEADHHTVLNFSGPMFFLRHLVSVKHSGMFSEIFPASISPIEVPKEDNIW